MGKLFGDKIAPYHMVSSLFLFLAAIYFYRFLKKLNNNEWFSLLLVSFIFVHPVMKNITEITFGMKYLFTLFVLTFGMYYSILEKLDLKKILILLGLYGMTVLSHEGAITFFFLWIVLRFISKQKITKNFFLLVLPVLGYLILRLFVFSVPEKGFMQVSWLYPLEVYPRFFNYVWTFNDLSEYWVKIVCGIIVLIGLIVLIRKRDGSILLWFACSIGVTLPFMVLINHIVPDRVIWVVVFAPTLLALTFKNWTGKKLYGVMILSLFLLRVSHSNFNNEIHNTYIYASLTDQAVDKFLKTPREIYKADPKEKRRFMCRDVKLYPENHPEYYFDLMLVTKSFAQRFAFEFPDSTAMFSFATAEKFIVNIYVRNGSAYWYNSNNRVSNAFDGKHDFAINLKDFHEMALPYIR